MSVKVTIPNGSADYLTFGSANTPVAAQVGGYEDSTGNGHLELYTTASGTVTEQVRVTSAGNVGIGTSSPGYKLDVQLGSSVNAQVKNTGASGYAQWKTVSPTTTVNFGSDSNGGYMETVGAYSNLFYTNGSERMRIDSSGNVLVGTDTASTSNTNSLWFQPSVGKGLFQHINGTATGTGYLAFIYNNSQIGSITQNGTTATAYNTSSDYRLKENVQPMVGALDTIAQLKPVTYNWIADGSNGQGFIAHELQAVVPDCVTGEKDAVDEEGNPLYQGIDTSFLVATLTAAIQEQQVLIQSQAAAISSLTERIEALETK